MSATARGRGFPRSILGIFLGYGGTVRLPRLIGLGESAQWIISGAEQTAETALAQGAVDAVAQPEELHSAALRLLEQAVLLESRRMAGALCLGAREGLGLPNGSVADLLAGRQGRRGESLSPHYPAAHDACRAAGRLRES